MFNSSGVSYYHTIIVRCLSIYALILVIVGTVGNILTIVILCRKNLRRHVTMRYLIAVSICDILSLYGWNLNNFYKFTISSNFSNLEDFSLLHCRIISYMTFVGLQLSSWCLATVSVDRCLSLYSLTWRRSYGKLSRTKYHIAILTVGCLLFNAHILFFNGYVIDPGSSTVKCYVSRENPYYIYPQWERAHLIAYNLCPFSIMCVSNIYIIYVTIRSARIRASAHSQSSRHRQLSVMLILITFVFVLLTLPSCLYFVFFRHRVSSLIKSRFVRYTVQICLGSVQFTAHAINFFLYCFSAQNFRNELRDFSRAVFRICIRSKAPLSSSTVVNSTNSASLKTRRHQHKKSKSSSTLEHQPTGQQYVLQDVQVALINND